MKIIKKLINLLKPDSKFQTIPEIIGDGEMSQGELKSPFFHSDKGIEFVQKDGKTSIKVDLDNPDGHSQAVNRNKLICGQVGSGKSVFFGYLLEHYYNERFNDEHISWTKGDSENVIYIITHRAGRNLTAFKNQATFNVIDNDTKLSFNPFSDAKSVLDTSQALENLSNLITGLWSFYSPYTLTPTKLEEINMILFLLIRNYFNNSKAEKVSFNGFVEYLNNNKEIVNIKDLQSLKLHGSSFNIHFNFNEGILITDLIDVDSFTSSMKDFLFEGKYETLLNASEDISNNRFQIYDLDNIKDNIPLYKTISSLITYTYLVKLKTTRSRSILALDEKVAPYCVDQYFPLLHAAIKQSRMHYGQVWIVNDSPILWNDWCNHNHLAEDRAREILSDISTYIFLDSRGWVNYPERLEYKEAARLIGTKGIDLLETLNRGSCNHKEFMIHYNGSQQGILGVKLDREKLVHLS